MKLSDFKKDLACLVEINSVQDEPAENAPFGKNVRLVLDEFLSLARSMGFQTIDYDGFAGEVVFGEGKDFGILCHLDIVPPGKLSDWNSDPFTLTNADGKLFGRGVLDDKGPALLILYALKNLKDENFRPSRKIRLILGCNEESGWECIAKLKELNALPEEGFSPDADFPVIYAEKGIAHVKFFFDCDEKLENIKGGQALNMVCDKVEATCPVDLNLLKDYSLSVENGNVVSVGKTAHGSLPHKGVNAFLKILPYLEKTNLVSEEVRKKLFENSTDVLRFNDDSGNITFSPDVVAKENGKLSVVVDVRYPATVDFRLIEKEFEKIAPYEILSHQPSLYVGKNDELVKTLCSVYNEITSSPIEPIAIGGGTYARALKKGVAFGPVFRDEDAVCHEPNEYMKVEDLLKAYEIYKSAIKKIAGKK